MKKITTSFLMILAFLIIQTNLVSAQENIIKSASEIDYPPYSIRADDGTASGFSVELLEESLSVMGYKVDFKVDSWEIIKNDLKEGNIKVLPLVGRTPEREAIYDFTFPYLTLRGTVFKRKSDSWINSIEDLRGKEIITMRGDNAEEYLRRENISDKLILTNTFTEAMQLLDSGKHDAVVAQRLMGLQLLRSLQIDSIESTGELLDKFTQDFSFAVKENDGEFLAELNEGLAIVMANGTFDKLYQKWFSPILSERQNFQDTFKEILSYLVPLFFTSLLISVIFLKKQINKKNIFLKKQIADKSKIEKELNENQKKLLNSNIELEKTKKDLVKKNLELNKTLEDFYTIRLSMQRDMEAGDIAEENKKIKQRLNRLKKAS